MARILLNRAQAAAMLNVEVKQIDAWRENDGLLCFTLKFRRRRFYSEAALKKWAKKRGKPVYEIMDPKDRSLYRPSGLWKRKCPTCGELLLFNRLLEGRPDYCICPNGCKLPDRHHHQSSTKCPKCGWSLVHNGRGNYKCPKGCKLPTIKCPKCGARFLLLRSENRDKWKCPRCVVDDSIVVD